MAGLVACRAIDTICTTPNGTVARRAVLLGKISRWNRKGLSLGNCDALVVLAVIASPVVHIGKMVATYIAAVCLFVAIFVAEATGDRRVTIPNLAVAFITK